LFSILGGWQKNEKNHFNTTKKKIIAVLVIITLTTFSIISAPARAAMVNTGVVFKQNRHDLSRERINMFIERSEVQKQLETWGV
jgi:hypothetical protein